MKFAPRQRVLILVTVGFLLVGHGVPALAGNWPMYRGDAARSGYTPAALPAELALSWTRQLPALQPTWPDQLDLREDAIYQPVVWEDLLLLSSSHNDTLTAYDIATGAERWRFYTDGPVRFAPAVADGKAVVASDDGWVYCLDVQQGRVIWKFLAAPREHRVLGNERLTSAWPVRGAPVIDGDKIYVTASIWPFMGVFVYALDLESGNVLWKNDGTGSTYTVQPHNSPAFASVAPQGYLAVNANRLLVPSGRSVPACFDLESGELEYFRISQFRKAGGYSVAVGKDWFLTAGHAFLLDGGELLSSDLGDGVPVFDAHTLYTSDGDITAYDRTKLVEEAYKDRLGRKLTRRKLLKLWEADVDCQVHLKAANQLIGHRGSGDSAKVVAVTVPNNSLAEGAKDAVKVAWEIPVKGTPAAMAAAADRLFVVTETGLVHCFAQQPAASRDEGPKEPKRRPDVEPSGVVTVALQKSPEIATGGYAVVMGLKDGETIRDLLQRTKLAVIGVDANAETVERLRRAFDATGDYGTRVSLHVGDPHRWHLPPYLANLLVSETPETFAAGLTKASAQHVFERLRPYGGLVCLGLPETAARQSLQQTLETAKLAGAEIAATGPWLQLQRVGSLPGSAPWTHQYADAGNSAVSRDSVVRAPLGVLWFGGPSNQDVLPRHGHGPSEQVIGGRLFIEGPDMIRAVDVYTGRLIWQRELPGVGTPYANTGHQPGANSIGSNYVSTTEGIYVAYGERCLCLDPATGETLREFTLPKLDLPDLTEKSEADPAAATRWGYVTVWQNLLLAGAAPQTFDGAKLGGNTYDGTSSAALVAFDRHSGKLLWQKQAKLGFRHNAIAIGADRVFCIDRLPDAVLEKLQRRGDAVDVAPQLLALDAATGEVAWSTQQDVFGTWLGYSDEFDVLIEAGRAGRDMLRSEPSKRMIAFQASTGKLMWDLPLSYGGPAMLHHQTIITQGSAFDLLTGAPHQRQHPITGETSPWEFSRNYGCNSAVASECLLTFRSAAAGFYDLLRDGGTGNLGGFRSSCTSNLIVADGVLNAPDYTRTCSCAYQNQASLALVHMPEAELWTFNRFDRGRAPAQRLAINFAAPGDRKADDETLWFEFPVVGGPSPDFNIKYTPVRCNWYRNHPSGFSGADQQTEESGANPLGLSWVASSGVEGCEKLEIEVNPDAKKNQPYTVRLHFAEPTLDEGTGRKFSISLQGKRVREQFCPVEEAGAARRSVVLTFPEVSIREGLEVTLSPAPGSKLPPILCGIELVSAE